MIDFSKGVVFSGGYQHYYEDNCWKAIVDGTPDEIKAEVSAYLAEHPEALVPEPVPEPPTEEELAARRRAEAQAYLNSTDWYVIRKMERSVDIPLEIQDKRMEAIEVLKKVK